MVENEREDYADVIVENGWSAGPNYSGNREGRSLSDRVFQGDCIR